MPKYMKSSRPAASLWRDMYIAQQIIRLHSWATQLERLKFSPSIPPSSSLWIQTLEQTYFVYCVLLVCRPISNANSWSYSLWLI